MSDCSAAAMLPKEPPRTCGGCSERYLAPKCNRLGWVDIEENDTPDDDGRTRADFCPYWKQDETDVLEQRCQQLEQVAKRLLRSVEFAAALLDGRTRYVEFDWDAIRDLRKQLEALGVNLDD